MLALTVKASKTYDVTVTVGMADFSEKIYPLLGENVAIIADETAYRLHGAAIESALKDKNTALFLVKSGEKSKNLENYAKILNGMAKRGFTRKDCVVTFGGGMVGDLGAFVASTYMRGIKLFAVPTTLLSAVDSSVGGKTAVNLDVGKNLCGTFYQPDGVYINLDFIKTLDNSQKQSGMGEVIKYAYLRGGENIKTDGVISEELIYNCLKIKADVVGKDEKESGERKVLNFGHTVGHAIEKLSDFTVPHGVCVAKGISAAISLSKAYFGLSDIDVKTLLGRLKIFSDLSCGYTPKELADVIISDKKNDGSGVDFVLINKELKTQFVKIPVGDIEEFLIKGGVGQ